MISQAPLVLGLNSVHPDSSAALAGPSGLIAAIAEERISRQKHSAMFPSLAVDEVLRIAGADRAAVTDIAIARDPRANMNARVLYLSSHPAYRPGAPARAVPRPSKNVTLASEQEDQLAASMPQARVHRVEHHLAHIASAFYCSGFREAAAVSIDGAGDWCTLMMAQCGPGGIRVLKRCHPPHSLGIFYTALSGYLGFRRYSEEYKVMGLSALGEDRFADAMRELVRYDPQQGIRLNTDYFSGAAAASDAVQPDGLVAGELLLPQMWTEKLEQLLGPARQDGQELEMRHHDIACSMQRRFEQVYMEIIRHALQLTGMKDLVMAGGCTHNAVANGLVLNAGICDRLYMHPAAGDDGTSVGAALTVLHGSCGVPVSALQAGAYWGPAWSDEQIQAELKIAGFANPQKLGRDALIDVAADSLATGKIVGWFQGREEWGPRALGNRSILTHPGAPGMKDVLNARVKHREAFRPFAPAVLADRLSDLYEGKQPVPFMNVVYTTRPEWRSRLSAVVHDDGTGRVQTVTPRDNEIFHALIRAFEKRTGVPVLLNTSFNENEPIVHTPAQAIACFARTKMDCLGIGSFWCEKK